MKRFEAGSGKAAPRGGLSKAGRSKKSTVPGLKTLVVEKITGGRGAVRGSAHGGKTYEHHSARSVVKGYFDGITGLSIVTDVPSYGAGQAGAELKTHAEIGTETFDVVLIGKGIFQVKPSALKHLQNYTDDEIHSLVVPKRTLARRVAEGEPLSVEETDKAIRLGRVDKLAADVFGDAAKAHRWLRKPKSSLGGETPLTYLATEAGARAVEEMLNQIDHGITP
jgi:putative toxin-antitoxin system antitoxin component (TIGR02293 family)